jgi:hypothetical protein
MVEVKDQAIIVTMVTTAITMAIIMVDIRTRVVSIVEVPGVVAVDGGSRREGLDPVYDEQRSGFISYLCYCLIGEIVIAFLTSSGEMSFQ